MGLAAASEVGACRVRQQPTTSTLLGLYAVLEYILPWVVKVRYPIIRLALHVAVTTIRLLLRLLYLRMFPPQRGVEQFSLRILLVTDRTGMIQRLIPKYG
ncbi:hypothetical protein BDV59DRAFT_169409 [Aspergillus ambiguus]|uniref:uncharacterized protein n=1 Tax=Aspergillus ambiguus TaxID=176160 RepID=UPI003CCE526E